MDSTHARLSDNSNPEGDMERARLYGVLASIFSYPTEELVDAVEEGLLEALSSVLGPLGVGRTALSDAIAWLRGQRQEPASLLNALAVDYTRLFITGMPRVIAPPYESVYVDRGLLMGNPVSSLVAEYRQAGLEVSESYDDLPDHLIAELEFMRYLVSAQLKDSLAGDVAAAESWLARQHSFLGRHLARWAPLCLERVAAEAETPFYRGLAQATQEFIDWDHNRLSSVPA